MASHQDGLGALQAAAGRARYLPDLVATFVGPGVCV